MLEAAQKDISNNLKYMSWFCIFLLLPFPVDIYYISRIILCFGAIYGVLKLYYLDINSDKIFLLGIVALIFNPLFPFYFQVRSVWMLMDVFAAYAFYVSSKEIMSQEPKKTTKKPKESTVYKEIQKLPDSDTRTEDQIKLDTELYNYHIELFTIKICDQIAHVVPRGIAKKEQLVLGLFYLYFVIEKLAQDQKPSLYANAGHGLFLNRIFIPKTYLEIEEDIHKIFYIGEVEKIIAEEARYISSIPKWLERIKSDGYSAAKISFSISAFRNSKYQYIEEFCVDLNSPELNGGKSPLFIIFQDQSYLKSIKQELERVVARVDKNFAKRSHGKDESELDLIINSQNNQLYSQKEIQINNITESKNDSEPMVNQDLGELFSQRNSEYEDHNLTAKTYDPSLNFKTIKPKGMQGSLNFSDPNNPTSKLDDSVQYFFAYSLYLLKTEANGLKLSESKKFDFRSKYIVDNKIKNHGVWFFSRIELESSKFTNYHVSSNTTDKIFKGDDIVISEIRSFLKTII